MGAGPRQGRVPLACEGPRGSAQHRGRPRAGEPGAQGLVEAGCPPTPKPCSETRTSGLLLPLGVRAEWVEEVQGVEPCVITSCRAGPGRALTSGTSGFRRQHSPLRRVLLLPSPLRAGSGPPCLGSGLAPMRWHFPHGRDGPSWCQPACPHPEGVGEALRFYSSLYKWYFF